MADVEIAETARHAADVVLTWVGFGTLTGLLAKAIMPGRDPGGRSPRCRWASAEP